jgi:hypothetical protein
MTSATLPPKVRTAHFPRTADPCIAPTKRELSAGFDDRDALPYSRWELVLDLAVAEPNGLCAPD